MTIFWIGLGVVGMILLALLIFIIFSFRLTTKKEGEMFDEPYPVKINLQDGGSEMGGIIAINYNDRTVTVRVVNKAKIVSFDEVVLV